MRLRHHLTNLFGGISLEYPYSEDITLQKQYNPKALTLIKTIMLFCNFVTQTTEGDKKKSKSKSKEKKGQQK
jgi:hypothetical protein